MDGTYLVTGAKGMLGRAVVARLRSLDVPTVEADLPEIDLAREGAALDLLRRARPTHVIHCAAYTDVNGAESEREVCRAANVVASERVARACAVIGARMLYLSTDFVFDGRADRPYREDDAPNPISYYALSKLEGERAVQASLPDHQIVRSAWLYGAGKRNFVTAILDRLGSEGRVNVVVDEIGNPTYVVDLAERLIALSQVGATGVFHAVNSGWCSRFELARAIAELSGQDPGRIVPIHASDWPSPAVRPKWSVLDCSRAAAVGLEPLRPWREALSEFLAERSRAKE